MGRGAGAESVFHAIACPTRRALLDVLARGESSVGDLVASLDVTQSAVSQQLAVLKSAGLAEERSEGRFRYYRLRAKPLREIDMWMNRYRAAMEERFDALGRLLDAMTDDDDAKAKPKKKKKKRKTP